MPLRAQTTYRYVAAAALMVLPVSACQTVEKRGRNLDPRLSGMDPRDVFALFGQELATREIMQRTVVKARRGGDLEIWGTKQISHRFGRIDPRSRPILVSIGRNQLEIRLIRTTGGMRPWFF